MSVPETPYTRGEMYLSAIADGDSSGIPERPYTRKEMYLDAIARGDSSGIPERPYTREEMYLDAIAKNGGGGGGDITVESKSISANGTYTAPTGKAYSPVTVSVPASAVDSGTKSITSNGNNQDVVGYAAVDVAVPNSYAAGDEGKVVSNGELVAQTAHAEVTQNGTIDTTLNNSVVVNVPDLLGLASQGTLTSYSDENITKPRSGAFGNIPTLEHLWLPNLTDARANKFIENTPLLKVMVFPKCNQFSNYSLQNTYLETIDFGTPFTHVCAAMFNESSHLNNLNLIILRRSSIVALDNINAFTKHTPFKSGGAGGTIYIPKVLYDHLGDGTSDDYRAATNWSVIDGYGTITWAKIEGSIYETQWADGTPIS